MMNDVASALSEQLQHLAIQSVSLVVFVSITNDTNGQISPMFSKRIRAIRLICDIRD
jgi:hypothetical protein